MLGGFRWTSGARAAALLLLTGVFVAAQERSDRHRGVGQVLLREATDPSLQTPGDPVWREFWVPIEQPERSHELTALVLEWAGVRGGMHVADVGAGGGYFAVRFARLAQPDGLVWAVDIDPRMVRKLAWERTSRRLFNLIPQLVEAGNLGLPRGSLDVVTLVDVGLFTTCSADEHGDYLRQIASALHPGGRWLIAGSLGGARGERCPTISPERVAELAAPWFARERHREFAFADGWRGHVTVLRRR